MGALSAFIAKANTFKSFQSTIPTLLSWYSRHLKAKGCIVDHGSVREKREGLKHHAQLLPPQLVQCPAVQGRQRSSLNRDVARTRTNQAIEKAQQGGFTGPRQAHHNKYFTRLDF